MQVVFPKLNPNPDGSEPAAYVITPEAIATVAAITFHSIIANQITKYSLSNDLQALHSWLEATKQPGYSRDSSPHPFSINFADVAQRLGKAVNYRQIDEWLGPSSGRDPQAEEGDEMTEEEKAREKEDLRRLNKGLRTKSQLQTLNERQPGWGLDLNQEQMIRIGMYLLLEVMQPKHGIDLK
jgi:hypothetical protein